MKDKANPEVERIENTSLFVQRMSSSSSDWNEAISSFDTVRNATTAVAEYDSVQRVLEQTWQVFPSCKNFLLFGLTKEELTHAICCISLTLKHNTSVDYINGRNVVFFCKTCGFHKPHKSKKTAEKDDDDKKHDTSTKSPDKYCPFFLQFGKFKNMWYFRKDIRLNCLERRFCTEQLFPDFCIQKTFIQFLVVERMKNSGNKMVDVVRIWDWLVGQGGS